MTHGNDPGGQESRSGRGLACQGKHLPLNEPSSSIVGWTQASLEPQSSLTLNLWDALLLCSQKTMKAMIALFAEKLQGGEGDSP